MSTKISLRFKTKYDGELLKHGLQVRVIRLMASVCFNTPMGWTASFKAIVDTGNPVTILPEIVHRHIHRRILHPDPVSLFGVGRGEVLAHLAEIEMAFVGKRQLSPPLRIKAYLLTDNSLPVLIGYEDVLTDVTLVSAYPRRKAYIEFR